MASPLKGEVVSQGSRVRSGPGTNFSIITTLTQGAVVDVLETQKDWVKIRYQTVEGFISAQLIEVKPLRPLNGYLIQQPDLLEVQLAADRIIPTNGLTSKAEIAVATTWNSYGGLMQALSELLTVPVSGLVAVLVAESSGRTFGPDGRMIIRFENHLFWRFWGEKNADVYNRHFAFDTSSPKNNWKGHQWRANDSAAWEAFHGTQAKEWDVLTFARTLDDTAALSSISMGAPQTMGFNFRRLGYESVQHMFDAFARSAHAQILALFDFVKGPSPTSTAIQALQNRDYLAFAGFYNGPANAATYEEIIRVRAAMYDRLIQTAVAAPPPQTDQRGPVAAPVAPTPAAPIAAPPTPVAAPPAPVAPTPAAPTAVTPAPQPVVVVQPPPAPPSNEDHVLIATTEGLNVRREPVADPSNVIERLRKNEPVTPLEPYEIVLDKIAKGEAGKQFIQIRTDEGRIGFAAAWLLTPADVLTKAAIDTYIDSIPDQYPIPATYDAFWAMQDTLGLPDPFNVLPAQIRTRHLLVNMQVNGFGPNSFAARNWRNWYSRIGGMHNGSDLIVETGTPLLAVADGIITTKWPFMGNRNEKTVTLWPFLPERFRDSKGRRMMSNILVAYGHMSNNTVRKELDVVKAGDIIGISGTPAGSTTNDHLHLEVHFLSGNIGYLNLRGLPPRKLLSQFKRDQPFSNQVPWNTLLFYSKRLIRYQQHQGKTIGYNGRPNYPTSQMLKDLGASHLDPLDEFSLAFFEYGIPVVWEKHGTEKWSKGAVPMDALMSRLSTFQPYQPYEAAFLP
jgi:murein DD-endopeptidase MepM/ murein hydrolase activator NlpD